MALVFCALMISQMTFAQGGGMHNNQTPEQRAQQQTNKLTQELSLNADQQKSIYSANLKAAQDMQAAMQSGDRSQMKTIQQTRDASFKQTLTADQYKKYEQLKEQMKEKMKEHRQMQQPSGDGTPAN
ncbi:multiple ligand-binding protein 1 [Taibaiella soli]|uniref:Multiple ligand-binding protein 1 n=2 Tax=Taibaiella soli TaxID=1649169 RepID=A0A2W2AVH5_9BACT|nr:multiple ligand-binding protein 1 [Taibaiella soli]